MASRSYRRTSPHGLSFSASENGVLIFRRSPGARAQLTWFDREGKTPETAGDPSILYSRRISPDQKSVVFFQFDRMSSNIWLLDGERGKHHRRRLRHRPSPIRSGRRTAAASRMSRADPARLSWSNGRLADGKGDCPLPCHWHRQVLLDAELVTRWLGARADFGFFLSATDEPGDIWRRAQAHSIPREP